MTTHLQHAMLRVHIRLLLLGLLSLVGVISGHANNIAVSNVALTGRNTLAGANNAANFTLVQFDLSWENSWRVSSGPSNWDAAWVFVKFQMVGGDWQHATLSTIDAQHSAPSGSTINAASDGKGIFIYRANNSNGDNNFSAVQLRWNYGANGLSDDAIINIQVFAIEMVYVPGGVDFNVGGGGGGFTSTTINTANATSAPSGIGSLGGQAGGYPTGQTSPNASWPNGYNAFYCMKYEISQGQYRDFLNTLTRSQQDTRTATLLSAGITSITNRFVMSNTSSISNRNGIRCDANIDANQPITFYCDLNNNGTGNEATDGEWVACNFLSWEDGAAYLDWAGMRPMTDLEYEKACRGNQPAVNGEYAWGSSTVAGSAYTLSGIGASNENIATNYSSSLGNAVYSTTDGSIDGPLRVGIFSANTLNSGRVSAGATYYGIMEMSGNVRERVLSIYKSDDRAYTGLHGDGNLTNEGLANVTNWPTISFDFRGGSWSDSQDYIEVSDNFLSITDGSHSRNNKTGIRGVRTQ